MEPQTRRTEPVLDPDRVQPPVKGLQPRVKGSLGVASATKLYDILKDLDELKPTISMKQLLVVAPECRATLNAALIRKRHRVKEVHEVALNLDPG